MTREERSYYLDDPPGATHICSLNPERHLTMLCPLVQRILPRMKRYRTAYRLTLLGVLGLGALLVGVIVWVVLRLMR